MGIDVLDLSVTGARRGGDLTSMVYDGERTYVGTVAHSVWETDGLPEAETPAVAQVRASRGTVTTMLEVYAQGLITREMIVEVRDEEDEVVLTTRLGTRKFADRLDATALAPGRYAIRLRNDDAVLDEVVVVRDP